MKRILASILALTLVFLMSACDNNQTNELSDEKETTQKAEEHQSVEKKIEGTFYAISGFSEGLAFVSTTDNKEKTYCINKDGGIIFEIEKDLSFWGGIDCTFSNGLALIDDALYDAEGNCTYPEDVGVTKFYDAALAGGYIIAERTTSSYDSTTIEIGIMDTSFNWIVEPSESLYFAMMNTLRSLQATYYRSYYYKDTLYLEYDDSYLNLNTGDVTNDAPFECPSFAWQKFSDHTYRDSAENIMLDLSEIENIYLMGDFTNGKAVIVFFNPTSSLYYFTLIDETGSFLFEPVECGSKSVTTAVYDGKNTIMLAFDSGYESPEAKCYNINGKLIGEMSGQTFPYMSYRFMLSEGVITLIGTYNNNRNCYYYNTNFDPLF